jgi:hypothetical protein
MERYRSGRNGVDSKSICLVNSRARGFESHPLRHYINNLALILRHICGKLIFVIYASKLMKHLLNKDLTKRLIVKSKNVNEEIIKLRQVKWKTTLSKQVDKFSEVISDDEVFEKYFGINYVEKLSNKSKELTRTNIKLYLIYAFLMLSLYASQYLKDSEFVVLGYAFKNLGYCKEFILLLAAIIYPITSILTSYTTYISALVKECLKKLAPNPDVKNFYSHLFVDNYFDWFTGKSSNESTIQHGFTVFLNIIFSLTLLILFFTLLAGSFFIQINVIYDVATNPSLPKHINIFIVTFSIVSISFSMLVSIIQLPMPEIDLSNISKLSKIREEDPSRYKKIMNNFSAKNARKDENSVIFFSAIIYVLTFTVFAIFRYPESFNNISYFLGKAMPGVLFVLILSNELIVIIKKLFWSWFFKKYPDDSDQRLIVFIKFKKILFLIKLMVPFLFSLLFCVL